MCDHSLRTMRTVILIGAVTTGMGLLAAALVVPVEAQTKKPVTKPVRPDAKPAPATKPATKGKESVTSKSAGAAAIPGIPANVPVAVRDELIRQFQEPQKEQLAEQKLAARLAAARLKRVEQADSLAEQAAALVFTAQAQRDAGQEAAAITTLQRVLDLTPNRPNQSLPVLSSIPSALEPVNVPHPALVEPLAVWTIEARVMLADLVLEHELSLRRANDVLQPAVQWVGRLPPFERQPRRTTALLAMPPTPTVRIGPPAKTGANKPGAKSIPTPIAPDDGDDDDAPPPQRDIRAIAADIWLRQVLFAVIRGELPLAGYWSLRAAEIGYEDTSTAALLANRVVSRQRGTVLPESVVNGDKDAAHAARLAIIFDEGTELERAMKLWDVLLKRPAEQLTAPQRSFVHFQRGRTRSRLTNPLDRDPKLIVADYDKAVKLHPLSEWADDALFLAGNAEFSLAHNRTKAVEYWRMILERHEGSEHLERSAYYIGVALELEKKWEEARLAYDDAKQRFPDSAFNTLIDKHLKKVNNELSRPKPKSKGTG